MPIFHKDLTEPDLHEPKKHAQSHQKGGTDELILDDLEVQDLTKGIILPDINGSGAKARLRVAKVNGQWQIVLEDV